MKAVCQTGEANAMLKVEESLKSLKSPVPFPIKGMRDWGFWEFLVILCGYTAFKVGLSEKI